MTDLIAKVITTPCLSSIRSTTDTAYARVRVHRHIDCRCRMHARNDFPRESLEHAHKRSLSYIYMYIYGRGLKSSTDNEEKASRIAQKCYGSLIAITTAAFPKLLRIDFGSLPLNISHFLSLSLSLSLSSNLYCIILYIISPNINSPKLMPKSVTQLLMLDLYSM